MPKYNKKVILLILDGWGIAKPDKFNAIDNANTPNIDRLIREYPNVSLKSDGESVGLPKGQFGTSEVNHMTIGAGRVILQDLPKINKAIEDKTFHNNKQLVESIKHAQTNGGNLHLIGILSDGGIHSTIHHPFAILDMLAQHEFSGTVFFHIFTDGRDTPPKSAEKYLKQLDEKIKSLQDLDVKIASIQGRFYLDRDRDWNKTEKALSVITDNKGKDISDWKSLVNFEYNQGNKDEFFPQYSLEKQGTVQSGDSVIFYHYRTDRLFQIVKALLQKKITNINVTTFISVSNEFKNVNVAFPRSEITDTLAESISNAERTQLHITETEKFPHVTFFLNGENEKELPGEDWFMVDSNRFVKPYYNYEPSMQNFEITKRIVSSIEHQEHDFIVANYTSADMVGHTGNYEAAVISAEAVDYAVGKVYDAIKEKLDEYTLIITSDHGNSDIMWDYENDQPHTQHTLNPVPFILVSDIKCKLDRKESLEDVAPTVLNLMGIDIPKVMTGTSLIIEK